jgi:hypothetical protein
MAEPKPEQSKPEPLSPRAALIARALRAELKKREALIEAQPDLRTGKPRTVLMRTEAKSELAGEPLSANSRG